MRDAFTIVVDPAYTQANGSSIALQSTLKLTRAFLVAPLYLWRAQMALTKCLLFLLATGSSLQFQTRVGGKRSSIRSRHFNVAQSALAESIDFKEARNEKSTGRVSILVCPAQFCVPDDYLPLFDNLKALESKGGLTTSIGSFRVAPLPRTEWIKVARQLPTKAFLDGCLPVAKTLGWYFDAMDRREFGKDMHHRSLHRRLGSASLSWWACAVVDSRSSDCSGAGVVASYLGDPAHLNRGCVGGSNSRLATRHC
jgi:hypothetical protein